MGLELKMSENIDVVMATYNGAVYVKQQIESILAQDYPSVRLIISDDGSTDSTPKILQEYAKKHPDIITLLPFDGNKGVIGNFSRLLSYATADYVCFSDQDDVWNKDKVSKSSQRMKQLEAQYGKNLPLLVHTDLSVVDKELNQISPSFWRYTALDSFRGNSLNRLLVQNCVTGCATMLNRPLIQIACPFPKNCVMHDHWVALVAAAFGKVEALPDTTIAYRQHGKNTLGAVRYLSLFYFKKGFNRFKEGNGRNRAMAREFLDRYEKQLSHHQRDVIESYLSLPNVSFFRRLCLILQKDLIKKGILRNISSLFSS